MITPPPSVTPSRFSSGQAVRLFPLIPHPSPQPGIQAVFAGTGEEDGKEHQQHIERIGKALSSLRMLDDCHQHSECKEYGSRAGEQSQYQQDTAKKLGECRHETPELRQKVDANIGHLLTESFPPGRIRYFAITMVVNEGSPQRDAEEQQTEVCPGEFGI